jgi:hypothetical protein
LILAAEAFGEPHPFSGLKMSFEELFGKLRDSINHLEQIARSINAEDVKADVEELKDTSTFCSNVRLEVCSYLDTNFGPGKLTWTNPRATSQASAQ